VRLYNSLTRQVEEVRPADRRTVRMYSCGPTVYRYAHVGNMRTFMLGDVIRRALRFEGQDVLWVMNITDVGHMTDDVGEEARDRMDIAVADEGLAPMEIARKYTEAFLEDADAIGIERADVYPKATEHIQEMLELTRTLLDKGHAYEVDGNVYFDVGSALHYHGPSSGRLLAEAMEVAPFSRLLFSSDAFGLAEQYHLGAMLFRRALREVLDGWIEADDCDAATAGRIAEGIARGNALRIYPLP